MVFSGCGGTDGDGLILAIMTEPEKFILLHGGYRHLKSFQVAREGKAEG
jgi:hypothetical protein